MPTIIIMQQEEKNTLTFSILVKIIRTTLQYQFCMIACITVKLKKEIIIKTKQLHNIVQNSSVDIQNLIKKGIRFPQQDSNIIKLTFLIRVSLISFCDETVVSPTKLELGIFGLFLTCLSSFPNIVRFLQMEHLLYCC